MTVERFEVRELPDQSRYVLIDHGPDGTLSKEIGEESYVDVGDERVLFHTGVSDEYSGKGLGSKLVRAVVDDIVAAGKRIVPVCPYVAAWLPKHPEYADHIAERRSEHGAAVKALTR
jgi:predicted GNAT family acetyltransferase